MNQMDDDIQLVGRFRSGDESAFDALLERYQRRVYATAYRMTNDLEEAKDVTQKVFLNVYQGLPGFRQDASFKTWLYQICVNVCLNQVRQRRSVEVELDESLCSGGQCPLSSLIEHEERARLRTALERVPGRQRMAVILRVYEGLDVRETASAMGCSEGAVKAHYHQAVQKLKKIMAEDGHGRVA
ncbi:MAG: sigma-70 family RNA polymerase sigma factor [Thermodesulfovibrionales bacterium]